MFRLQRRLASTRSIKLPDNSNRKAVTLRRVSVSIRRTSSINEGKKLCPRLRKSVKRARNNITSLIQAALQRPASTSASTPRITKWARETMSRCSCSSECTPQRRQPRLLSHRAAFRDPYHKKPPSSKKTHIHTQKKSEDIAMFRGSEAHTYTQTHHRFADD